MNDPTDTDGSTYDERHAAARQRLSARIDRTQAEIRRLKKRRSGAQTQIQRLGLLERIEALQAKADRLQATDPASLLDDRRPGMEAQRLRLRSVT